MEGNIPRKPQKDRNPPFEGPMSRLHIKQHDKLPQDNKDEGLDRTTVLAHFNYDEALMANELDRFSNECPMLMSEVRDAIEHGERSKLLRATHALKCFVEKFSAKKTLKTLVLLEATVGNDDLALAEKAYEFLEEEIKDLRPRLSNLTRGAGHVRILIAEDDPVSRCMLEAALTNWGYEDLVVVNDGREAWKTLQGEKAPSLAILDWLMPGMDGIEVCRNARRAQHMIPTYIILLTVKGRQEDLMMGFQAGADDYMTKPFDTEELHARLQVGVRIVTLQRNLADRVKDLENALLRVKQLQGLLPICSYCKKIRDDYNYWQQVENYIAQHTAAQFSHAVCPDCYKSLVKPQLERYNPRKK
jgi:sigma-B regulation protein RsbU (phosphoserine phosphatase)